MRVPAGYESLPSYEGVNEAKENTPKPKVKKTEPHLTDTEKQAIEEATEPSEEPTEE